MQYVLAILLVTTCCAKAEDEKDYMASMEKVEEMLLPPGIERMVFFGQLKVVRREHFLNGTIHFNEDLTNEEYQLTVDTYSSPTANNVYKKLPIVIPPTPVCDAFSKLFRDYVQPSVEYGVHTNIPPIPEEGVCPLPAGEYYFKEVLLKTDNWPNRLPHGMFKAELKYYKHSKFVGGVTFYVLIEDATR